MGATIDAQEKTDVELFLKYHEKTQFTIRVRTDLWRGETVSGPRVPRKMVVIAHYNKMKKHECTYHRRRNLGGAPWLPGASIVAEMVGIYQCVVSFYQYSGWSLAKRIDSQAAKDLGEMLESLPVELPALQIQFQKQKEVFKSVNYRTYHIGRSIKSCSM